MTLLGLLDPGIYRFPRKCCFGEEETVVCCLSSKFPSPPESMSSGVLKPYGASGSSCRLLGRTSSSATMCGGSRQEHGGFLGAVPLGGQTPCAPGPPSPLCPRGVVTPLASHLTARVAGVMGQGPCRWLFRRRTRSVTTGSPPVQRIIVHAHARLVSSAALAKVSELAPAASPYPRVCLCVCVDHALGRADVPHVRGSHRSGK